jgi:hypothetical protein
MTTAPSPPRPIDDCVFGNWAAGFGNVAARTAIVLAVAVNCVIFVFGSRWFGMPDVVGYDGSLLNQPNPVTACLAIALLLLIGTLVGTVIAGAVRFEAGLLAAGCGLAAVSERCGTMQTVILESGANDSIYMAMVLHLLILAVFLLGLWALLWGLGRMNWVVCTQGTAEELDPSDSAPVSRITALAAQVVTTGIFMMFLCQSETKNQALASVGIASFLGAVISYKYSPVRPSIWYWSGPLIVGVIGYTLAATGQDANLAIGSPTGTFAALARPLPIDYASLGPAGAILGYWTMRKKIASK